MVDPDKTGGAPPRAVHIGKKKGRNWLAWIALAAGIVALLLALGRCNRDRSVAVAPAPAATPTAVVGATPGVARSTALAGTSALGGYLAGSDAAPRSFTFETLTFDTAKSDIRAADAGEIDRIATTLKQYGTSRIRIAGYADARGSDSANAALGKARAEAVKTALVGRGIEAGRVETVSGGETDPVGTNATTSGQAENRRTELVVTAR